MRQFTIASIAIIFNLGFDNNPLSNVLFNKIIQGVGENEAASLMSTALLKQFNIKRIIGRVVSDLQKTVLEAMEIEEFIMPEEESTERLAVLKMIF